MRAPGARPSVALRTLGCKVNRAESEALAAALVAAGFDITPEEDADAVVVNTCTVTGEADAKARKALRRALGAPRAPVVVATGCMVAAGATGLATGEQRLVLEPDKDRVVDRVLQSVDAASGDGGPPRVLQAGEAPKATGGPRRSLSERRTPTPGDAAPRTFNTRVMVKVQDGCDDRCAYCIVPDARGPARSVPLADVVARVAALAAAGTAEVVLTGVNIGRYRDGSADLGGLVRAVAASGVRRVRISSIEPLDLTDGLLAALAATGVVAPHLHVPLQSGSDAVLARMGRPYAAAAFADRVAAAHVALPGLAVTADVIAGLPGETDADHAATLALVAEAGLAGLHVFRYSKRRGTRAAGMPDQVAPEVKAARAAELREAGATLARAYAAARVGGHARVVIERVGADKATGVSGDHLRVTLPAAGLAPGDLVDARIVAADGAAVRAVIA